MLLILRQVDLKRREKLAFGLAVGAGVGSVEAGRGPSVVAQEPKMTVDS